MSLDVQLIEHLCPQCGRGDRVYSANITHNLIEMAKAAGIYDAVWNPEDNGIRQAYQLIPIIETGIKLMESDPERFKKFDSPNGWGSYVNFVPRLKDYLKACRNYPEANISVDR